VVSIAADTDTETRGIQVTLTGDSGDDSGNVDSEVYQIQIREDSQAWSAAVNFYPIGSGPWVWPFYLTTSDGLKTVQARGIDRAGNAGTLDSVGVTLTEAGATTPPFDTSQAPMLGHDITSDGSAVVLDASDETTDFPVENLQDARLARVWTGGWQLGGGNRFMVVTFDLGAAKTIDIAAIKNQNLHLFADETSFEFKLCAHASDLGVDAAGFINWRDSASYQVSLKGLLSSEIIVHRPEAEYRYWAVICYFTN
ncbi:unnamed protein product, partial [marine sediment metagenome]